MKIHVTDRNGVASCLEAEASQPMMQALSQSNLVEATCGGACSCATCHVYVGDAWQGRLPPPNGEEASLIEALLNTRPSSRLACQIMLSSGMDGIEVTVAPE